MADARAAMQPLGRRRDQVIDAAGLLVDLQAATSQDGDTGRVIATVLKALECLENDGDSVLATDVADNAAHDLPFRPGDYGDL